MRFSTAMFAATIAVVVVISGCDSQAAPKTMDMSTARVIAVPTPPGPQSLSDRAALAMSEQRIHAPAGNNAIEYYLDVRAELPDDPSAVSALEELQPYLLVACEQATARRDLKEAQRLLDLATRVDANSPSLPRLRQNLRSARG